MSRTVLPVGFEVLQVFRQLFVPKIFLSGTVLPVGIEVSRVFLKLC